MIREIKFYKNYFIEFYLALDKKDQEKIDLLRRVDAETRKLDHRIEEVIISLVAVYESVLVASQDGAFAGAAADP